MGPKALLPPAPSKIVKAPSVGTKRKPPSENNSSASSSSSSSDDEKKDTTTKVAKHPTKRARVIGWDRSQMESKLAKAKATSRANKKRLAELKEWHLDQAAKQQEEIKGLREEKTQLTERMFSMMTEMIQRLQSLEQRSNAQAVQGVNLIASTTNTLLSMHAASTLASSGLRPLLPDLPANFRHPSVWKTYEDSMKAQVLAVKNAEELQKHQALLNQELQKEQHAFDETSALIASAKIDTLPEKDRIHREHHYVLCQAAKTRLQLIRDRLLSVIPRAPPPTSNTDLVVISLA